MKKINYNRTTTGLLALIIAVALLSPFLSRSVQPVLAVLAFALGSLSMVVYFGQHKGAGCASSAPSVVVSSEVHYPTALPATKPAFAKAPDDEPFDTTGFVEHVWAAHGAKVRMTETVTITYATVRRGKYSARVIDGINRKVAAEFLEIPIDVEKEVYAMRLHGKVARRERKTVSIDRFSSLMGTRSTGGRLAGV